MILIQGTNNVDVMLRMYAAVGRSPETETRGMKTRNVHNLCCVFNAADPLVTSFHARNMNLNYAKREWLWYLGADKFDASIEEHATMWAKLKQEDGSYHSNYGQYIFNRTGVMEGDPEISQFDYVVNTLAADRYSRRASMVLLQPHHLYPENSDVVCTYAVNFTIAEQRLFMTVMMRSNDVIFGFTNDAFCFWNLYAFVHALLAETHVGLGHGTYTHVTNSMHVYERHYEMIKALTADKTLGSYQKTAVPWPTADEVRELVDTKGLGGSGGYVDWLKT